MNNSVPTGIAALAVAACAGFASAQPAITVIGGYLLQSWNAGTGAYGYTTWNPEKPTTGYGSGLRWEYLAQDGGGATIPQYAVPVNDPQFPGITAALQFPEMAAVGPVAAAWENQATAGTPCTFEIWFKPSDLTGTHILFETGAIAKGIAFVLNDDELVFLTAATDGAGGNSYATDQRTTLTDTGWHQAVITVDYAGYFVSSYFDGVLITSESIPPSGAYRWTASNPAGLGTLALDPLFPDSAVPGDVFASGDFTDFDGQIAIMRWYNIDLFDNEVNDNYAAVTDSYAGYLRANLNNDLNVDGGDQLALVTLADNADTAPIARDFTYPFPSNAGGVQTNDPAQDEGYVGDFAWDLDSGFNPGAQEPTYQFPVLNVLEPVTINDADKPAVRKAFVLNGDEAFRGPKFEQADDTTAVRVAFWMYFDDVVGNHCLFEAGGTTVGFSVCSVGDDLVAGANTNAPALDVADVTAADVLTPGWHRIDFVVRRYNSPTDGQGVELTLDGVQVARYGDLPGPDGIFGVGAADPNGADDVNLFDIESGGNTNIIGGNQAGYGQVQGTAYLPNGLLPGDLTPFNGLAGPIVLIQDQPTEALIQAEIAADAAQNVMNDRNDYDGDGEANFLDVIEALKMIDAAR